MQRILVPLLALLLLSSPLLAIEDQKTENTKTARVLAVKAYENGRIARWEGRVPIFDGYPFYDITLAVGDRTYVVRYENVTGYYPTSWKPGREIKVRLAGRGTMYLLNGAEEVEVGIFNNKAQQCVFVNSPPSTQSVGPQVPCQ